MWTVKLQFTGKPLYEFHINDIVYRLNFNILLIISLGPELTGIPNTPKHS